MKKYLSVFVFAVFLFPSVSFASTLTTNQVNSIILLLEAFGVDHLVVLNVQSILQPQGQPLTQTTTTKSEEVSTVKVNPTLSLSLGQVTKTTESAHMQWATTIPSESKVFLTETGSTNTQVIASQSGLSTNHLVSIEHLVPNTTYRFTVEAISGTQDQKYTDSFTTDALPPAPKFTQYPTFEKAASDQLRVSWRTDITSEAWILLCGQNPKQYGIISTNGCFAQTNNRDANPRVLDTLSAIPTSGYGSISDGQYFAAYIPAYHNQSTTYYLVEVGANGQRVDYGGVIPQL